MKRTIVCVLALAGLAAVYLASQALAQQPMSPAPPATKVGLVNFGVIFKDWYRVAEFKQKFEADLKPFRDKEVYLKKVGSEWEAALRGGKLKDEEKAKGEKTIIEVRRQLEDLKREYQTKVAKQTEEQLVALYSELNQKVEGYAASQGYHIILAYGEPVDGNLNSFVNVTRKMQAMDGGALVPMYFSRSLDISQPLLSMLNANRPVSLPTGQSK